jgi:hypothetical protein
MAEVIIGLTASLVTLAGCIVKLKRYADICRNGPDRIRIYQTTLESIEQVRQHLSAA